MYPLAADSGSRVNQSLIGVKQPVYVAGLDLGVLPIGDWLMSIILSIYLVPFRLKFFSSLFNELFRKLFSRVYKVSITNDDFPLPDTPVTQIKLPRLNETD